MKYARKAALKTIDKMGNLQKNLQKVEESLFNDDTKDKRKKEKEQEFIDDISQDFKNAESKLNKKIENTKSKLQDMYSGEYEKRNYYHNKVTKELKNYDDPVEFIENKSKNYDDPVELQEAVKTVVEYSRAKDKGQLEQLKGIIGELLPEKELKVRKELKKAEIYKENLKGAQNTIKNDIESIKQGNTKTTKECLVSYLDDNNLDKIAEKRIFETIK